MDADDYSSAPVRPTQPDEYAYRRWLVYRIVSVFALHPEQAELANQTLVAETGTHLGFINQGFRQASSFGTVCNAASQSHFMV